MKRFRLPRKIKKSLKKTLWLYPTDEKGNSLMVSPARSQEDYTAFKNGIVRNVFDPKNAKARRKAFSEKLDKETIVTDEVLKSYVDDIFHEDFRTLSYNILKVKVISNSYIVTNIPNGISPTFSGKVTDFKTLVYSSSSKPVLSFVYSNRDKAVKNARNIASNLNAELVLNIPEKE